MQQLGMKQKVQVDGCEEHQEHWQRPCSTRHRLLPRDKWRVVRSIIVYRELSGDSPLCRSVQSSTTFHSDHSAVELSNKTTDRIVACDVNWSDQNLRLFSRLEQEPSALFWSNQSLLDEAWCYISTPRADQGAERRERGQTLCSVFLTLQVCCCQGIQLFAPLNKMKRCF